MSINDDTYIPSYSFTQADLGTTLSPHHLFRWSGAPPVAQLCGAGQDPDGVTGHSWVQAGDPPTLVLPWYGTYSLPGRPVKVEAGGAFVSGANLQSDAFGRAVQHASGPVVLRALEGSSGAGQIIWAVFISGR